jgi:hypothetical protein
MTCKGKGARKFAPVTERVGNPLVLLGFLGGALVVEERVAGRAEHGGELGPGM